MARQTGIPRWWWRFMSFYVAFFVAYGVLFMVRGLSVAPTETLFIADGAVLIGFAITYGLATMATQRGARRIAAVLSMLAVALLIAFAALTAATLILCLRNVYM